MDLRKAFFGLLVLLIGVMQYGCAQTSSGDGDSTSPTQTTVEETTSSAGITRSTNTIFFLTGLSLMIALYRSRF